VYHVAGDLGGGEMQTLNRDDKPSMYHVDSDAIAAWLAHKVDSLLDEIEHDK
jgi:aspartokinase-like uncharacterized kinase